MCRLDGYCIVVGVLVVLLCFVFGCGLFFYCFFFFFQAEDGIRDRNVTGVQTCALPISSLVAVIVTGPPGPTPVTSPLPFTLAIALLLDCQVITRPVNGLPFASRGVAVSCTVCPCSTLTEAGLTVTEATGTVGTIFTR